MIRSLYKPLKIGYVPLTDCAPIIMARELGLFKKYGIPVELSREIGWATIRDKIIYGELDAAHALAAMPFAATLGLGSIVSECVAGIVLSLHGNGITLSKDLRERGVVDAKTLRHEIERSRGERLYTFGVVFPYSTHHYLLRQWLLSGGINPDEDVNIVVVPAPSTFGHLKSGNLDGYCVGEPWNTMAIKEGIGWAAATSIDLAPGHPEKVLLTQRAFAEGNPDEYTALLAALIESCAWCDRHENRERLVETLAQPHYINVPKAAVRASLMDAFDYGYGRTETLGDFHVFHRYAANEPSPEKAAWVLNHLVREQHPDKGVSASAQLLQKVFRRDFFLKALALTGADKTSTDPQLKSTHELETANC